jgi:hypothetical protein
MSITIVHEAEYDARGRKIADKIGRCECGELIELGGFTNTCECGRDYNWNGSLLAPRQCWGEETGEHWLDVVNG